MRRKQDGWSVVLAGHWNRMIFTPEWVARNLFPDAAEIDTLVALLPIMPLIYRNREVAVEIANSRLVFRPRILDGDASLLRAEGMARRVLNELPQTPLQAIGLNFAYREPHSSAPLLELLNNLDDARLGVEGWGIQQRKLTRRLSSEGRVLNLTLTLTGETVDFDLNFHSESTDGRALGGLPALAEGRSVALRNAGLDLIRQVYRLELEGDHADE